MGENSKPLKKIFRCRQHRCSLCWCPGVRRHVPPADPHHGCPPILHSASHLKSYFLTVPYPQGSLPRAFIQHYSGSTSTSPLTSAFTESKGSKPASPAGTIRQVIHPDANWQLDEIPKQHRAQNHSSTRDWVCCLKQKETP